MARAERTDFYQNFRFWVSDPGGFLSPAAGFQAVSTPEYTLDPVEYREGTYTFTRKQPGYFTTNEITLSRGVARRDSDFYAWVQTAGTGGEYRSDIEIWHFHRADPQGVNGTPSRTYRLLECFPTRCKIAADLDSQSSDISLEELDLQFESFDVQQEGAVGVGTV